MAYSQYFDGLFEGLLPNAAITDSTAPTFAGIASLSANSDGSLTATYLAASDATAPIHYNIYVQANSASGLFSPSNIALRTPQLTARIFTLANGNYLQNGTTYFVGVRAVDGVGNMDGNTVSDSEISNGVLQGAVVYAARAVFSIDNTNMLQISAWITGNDEVITSLLGTASYTVYDQADVAVPLLTESGVAANGNGVYVFTPVSAASLDAFTHYRIKIEVVHDSAPHVTYKGLTIFE